MSDDAKDEEGIIWGGIAAGAVLILLMVAIAPKPISPPPAAPTAPARPLKDPAATRRHIDEILARRGKAIVLALLKDPDSAKFSDVSGRVKHGTWVACGYVNARNGFGGMVGSGGWVAFPVEGRAYFETGSSAMRFVRNWNRYCTGPADPVDTDVSALHVATREIKRKKLACGTVTEARDLPDGSVAATCSNKVRYRVSYIPETDHYLTFEDQDAAHP